MPGSFPPVFKELSSSPEFVVEQVLAAAQRYVYASLLTPGRHLRNICWMNKLFFWEDWLLIKNPFPLFITSYIPFPHFILKTAVLGWPPLGTRHAGITVSPFTKWGGWAMPGQGHLEKVWRPGSWLLFQFSARTAHPLGPQLLLTEGVLWINYGAKRHACIITFNPTIVSSFHREGKYGPLKLTR